MPKDNSPHSRYHASFDLRCTEIPTDPKTLSEALGHATVAFTLDVYGHSNEDMKQQAADQFEELICQY